MALRLPELVRDSCLETIFNAENTVHIYHDRPGRRAIPRRETWKKKRILGSGGNGVVWLEEQLDSLGKDPSAGYRAVKQITSTESKSILEICKSELEALAKFSTRKYAHCFVQSFGWYQGPNVLSITMEYCPNGDLQNYLLKHVRLPESDTQEIISQVVQGLHFMHEEGFAHRDLKPGNILIKSLPPEDYWWVKICDLGLSKRIEGVIGHSTTVKGTLGYLAPELLGFGDSDPRKADPYAIDMWCLGEMTYRMLCGNATFASYGQVREYQLATRPFPEEQLYKIEASKASVSFTKSAMKAEPRLRLNVHEAFYHGWLKMKLDEPQTSDQSTRRPAGPLPSFNITDLSRHRDEEPSGSWSTITDPMNRTSIPLRPFSAERVPQESRQPSYGRNYAPPSPLSKEERLGYEQTRRSSPARARSSSGSGMNQNERQRHTHDEPRRRSGTFEPEKYEDGSNKMQKAAAASIIAGATEAFRVHREPGSSSGDKMRRILAAAAGAATIDAATDNSRRNRDHDYRHGYKDNRRSLDPATAIIGDLAANRVVNGPSSNDRAEPAETRRGTAEPTTSARVSTSPAMEKLRAIESYWNTTLLPRCLAFSTSPPRDIQDRHNEHLRLNAWADREIFFKLDEIVSGDDEMEAEVRAKRKVLLVQVQSVLARLEPLVDPVGQDDRLRYRSNRDDYLSTEDPRDLGTPDTSTTSPQHPYTGRKVGPEYDGQRNKGSRSQRNREYPASTDSGFAEQRDPNDRPRNFNFSEANGFRFSDPSAVFAEFMRSQPGGPDILDEFLQNEPSPRRGRGGGAHSTRPGSPPSSVKPKSSGQRDPQHDGRSFKPQYAEDIFAEFIRSKSAHQYP
ncbi:hypothetical protein PFICI_11555 [Pestalotiopsis fici W106-1]|uniref:non-specific serine/threonine protein kinase n=1 Tax=Pestalotiopsis fici (strain W106-1 / CGMCC3.15140) TaxID=1229662 RepID=W3WQQ0_PESFW|nr:uncharacterized protein PFICI_11555 [Pestalotiopsis fici W106-1]ETS76168.1 hypothetical protein PFICI_11555 [Pestalotiopsis fici W106-1]